MTGTTLPRELQAPSLIDLEVGEGGWVTSNAVVICGSDNDVRLFGDASVHRSRSLIVDGSIRIFPIYVERRQYGYAVALASDIEYMRGGVPDPNATVVEVTIGDPAAPLLGLPISDRQEYLLFTTLEARPVDNLLVRASDIITARQCGAGTIVLTVRDYPHEILVYGDLVRLAQRLGASHG